MIGRSSHENREETTIEHSRVKPIVMIGVFPFLILRYCVTVLEGGARDLSQGFSIDIHNDCG